jgi:predicted nucleic acid-binding protein
MAATRIEPEKLRVMVDANILIAGTGWPRFAYEVLQHALQGDFVLVLSSLVIEETRMHLKRLIPAMLERFEDFLRESGYEEAAPPTAKQVAANKQLVRDHKDIPVALAAINAQVDCLVTQDKDFTDQDETTIELHRQLCIMLPGTFLRELMGWTSEELEVIRTRSWEDFEA